MTARFKILTGGMSMIFSCLSGLLFSQALDTLLPINERGKWGFINTKGVVIFPCEFESALYWGCARYGKVKKDGEWQFINRQGLKLPLPIAGIPESFNDSILIIRSNEGKYLLSETGKMILPGKYREILPLRNGYFSYSIGDGCGLGHITHGILSSDDFDSIFPLKDVGFAVVSCNKYGLIDFNGGIILPSIYNSIAANNGDLLQLRIGEASKTGIFNWKKNEWLIQCNWEELADSSANFVVMEDERGSSLFNRKINMWYPEIYSDIELINTIAMVQSDTGKGIINADNRVVLEPHFNAINLEHGAYIVQLNGTWRLFNYQGIALAKDSFLNVQTLSAPAWILERDDDWVMIDSSGNIMLRDMHSPEILGNKVKYYKDATMTSLEVNETGQIVSKQSFDNVVKLQVTGFKEKRQTLSRMSNNQDLSEPESLWFMDETSRKWGLKRADGKILVNPIYDYIYKDQEYKFTHVYLKTLEKEVYLLRNYMKVGARAGLVDNESGRILVEPIYLDVFITGPRVDPLFFGITEQFKFKQVIPASKISMPTYAWVESSFAFPLRALANNGLPKQSINSEGRIFNQQEMMNRIFNPLLNKFDRRNSNRLNWAGYDDERWVYLFPGEIIPNVKYSKAERNSNGLLIAQEYNSKKYGLLDKNGLRKLPFEYTQIKRVIIEDDTLYKVVKADSNYNLITSSIDIFATEINNEILRYDGNNVFIKTPAALGYFNENNAQVLFPEAQKMGEMKDGIIAVQTNLKWSYYHENGYPFLNKQFIKAYDFYEGKALVKEHGKWHFLNTHGNLSEALPWKIMKPLSQGRFMAYDGKRWYLTDADVAAIHENGFLSIRALKDSEFLIVRNGSKWGLFNADGEQLTEIKYNRIQHLGDDLFTLEKGGKLYLKHTFNKEKRIRKYTHISRTQNGIFALRNKKGWILADTSLNLLGDKVYNSIRPLKQGFFQGNTATFSYLVDSTGKVIASIYDRIIGSFSDGYILLNDRASKSYYFQNTEGKQAFSANYLKALPFSHGKAWVKTQEGWGCIDTDGEWIVKPYFYDLKKIQEDVYVGKTGVLYGLFDKNGNVLLEPMFNQLEIKEKRLLYGEVGTHVDWKYRTGEKIYKRGLEQPMATKP